MIAIAEMGGQHIPFGAGELKPACIDAARRQGQQLGQRDLRVLATDAAPHVVLIGPEKG